MAPGPDTGCVLHEIDAALRAMLAAVLPEGTPVRFDAPDRTWRAGDVRGLDVFLYGIREDLSARSAHWSEQRDINGRVVSRQPSIRRYNANYLITSWADDPGEEHRLLGLTMAALAMYEVIPSEYLVGSLLAAEVPVGIAVAHPDYGGVTADVWAALGIAPRVSLDVVVAASLVPALVTNLADAPRRVVLGAENMPNRVGPPAKEIPKLPPPQKSLNERP